MNYAVAIQPSQSPYQGERAAAFAAARRHSKLVRFLRVAILGGAAGAIAVLALIAVFDPFGHIVADLSIGSLSLDGTRVAMDRPKLAGFRKDGRPYLVNAERAIQDVLHPTMVELRGIDAEVGIAGNGASKVTAEMGVYDSATEHMDLSRNIHVKSDEYDVRPAIGEHRFQGGASISRTIR